LLKNPWNLTGEQKERLSTLVRWNNADCPCLLSERILPTVLGVPTAQTSPRASPKVDEFGDALAVGALQDLCQNAPFPFGWNLPWTKLRLSNGAVEGMNNKIKSISHRSFGFRSAQYFIAAIYHCCAQTAATC